MSYLIFPQFLDMDDQTITSIQLIAFGKIINEDYIKTAISFKGTAQFYRKKAVYRAQ